MTSKILFRTFGVLSQMLFQIMLLDKFIKIADAIHISITFDIIYIIFSLNFLISLSLSYIDLLLITLFEPVILMPIISVLNLVSNPIVVHVLLYLLILNLVTLINQLAILSV